MRNDVNQEYQSMLKKTNELRRRRTYTCNHVDGNGIKLSLVRDSSSLRHNRVPNAAKLPDDAVICEGPNGCGQIFAARGLTDNEVDSTIFNLETMANQFKTGTVMTEKQQDEMAALCEYIDTTIKNFGDIYKKFTEKKLSGDGDNGGNKHHSSSKGNLRGGFDKGNVYS